MNQGDEIEPVLDRVMETDLLVPAISLIDRIEENFDRKRPTALAAMSVAALKCFILRGIVDHQ